MHLYKDCGDLPIRNFDIIHKTNDFRHLIFGWNGYDDVIVPKGANERWEAIKKEWMSLIENNETAYYYQLISDVTYLRTRYEVAKLLLYEIYSRNMEESTLKAYTKSLKHWNYIWNFKNSKINEVHRLMKQWKASKNKLDLKEDELAEMQKKNNSDEEVSSLEKQAVILEQVTGRNNIDIEITSVRKWVELTKLGNIINEERKRHGKK